MDIALSRLPRPLHVLDVGFGSGYPLREFARRCPATVALTGIDPAFRMIEVACVDADDDRLHFVAGAAENLRFSDGVFDLVVAATSFDHWCDQRAGFAECFRVLAPDGALVLTDLFSTLLTPTALFGRAGRARAVARANVLLDSAGFQLPTWQKPVRNLSCLRHAHQDRNGFEMIGGRLSPSVT